MKKSLLEKMGLVEAVQEASVEVKETEAYSAVPVQENLNENIIDTIYENNEMTDKGISVYKVDDLRSTLPLETPEKTAKVIVSNLMKTLGLSVDAVNADAANRIDVLVGVKNCTLSQYDDEKAKLEASVQEMKEHIQEAEQKIAQLDADGVTVAATVDAEVTKIKKTLSFIGAEEVATSATE